MGKPVTKTFSLGAVLTITTGYLLCRDRMDGVYEILNHMTGDNLFTHQLPRATRECKPWLLEQHPQLAGVEPDSATVAGWDDDEESVYRWVDEQSAIYGETLPVKPLPRDSYVPFDPLTELRQMRPDGEIIVVDTEQRP